MIPYTNIYKSTTIFINGRKLTDLNLSAREKEFLLTTMENYLIMKNNGGIDIVKTRVESRYPFLTNSSFYPLIKDKIYNRSEDITRFELWFKQRCTQLLKFSTISVDVLEKSYEFNKNTFSANLIKSKRVAFF